MTAGRLICRRERPLQDGQRCSEGALKPSARAYSCPLEQRYSYIGNFPRPPAYRKPPSSGSSTDEYSRNPQPLARVKPRPRFHTDAVLVPSSLFLIYSPADTFPHKGE